MTDDTGKVQGSDYEVGYKKPPKSTRFKTGDPKINKHGRPKTFNMARALAQDIAHEPLAGDGGASVLNKRGEIQTRIEAILRTMSSSRNPKLIELFLAYAVGKPKDEVDVQMGGAVTLNVVYKDKANGDGA